MKCENCWKLLLSLQIFPMFLTEHIQLHQTMHFEEITWKFQNLKGRTLKIMVCQAFYFYSNMAPTWTWSVILSSCVHCLSPLPTSSHDLNLMTHDPYCCGLGIKLPNPVPLVSFYQTRCPCSIPTSSCPPSFGGTDWENNNLLEAAMG